MNVRMVKVAAPLVAILAVTAAQMISVDGIGTPLGASTPHLMASTSGGDFGTTGLGNVSGGVPGVDGNAGVFSLTNDGGSTDTIDLSTGAVFTGPSAGDWVIVATRG